MSNQLKYTGTQVTQREDESSPKFFTFYAPTSEITKWAGIKRTAEVERGTQRVLNPPRVKSIARYLSADLQNTLPGCIIIGFASNKASFQEAEMQVDGNRCADKIQNGILTIDFENGSAEHEKPGLIVDGQHRLKGSEKFTDEDIPLLCVAILDSDIVEEAFQFIVINQKASKVKTTNIKSIIAEIGSIEERLAERLSKSGIRYGENTPILTRLNSDETSPFYKIIAWEINERDANAESLVQITAIETCLKQIQVKFDDYLELVPPGGVSDGGVF